MRAEETPPRVVPVPRPKRLAPLTMFPAATDAVWEPWPSESLGEANSLAPNFLPL